jgi:hypothetical protein
MSFVSFRRLTLAPAFRRVCRSGRRRGRAPQCSWNARRDVHVPRGLGGGRKEQDGEYGTAALHRQGVQSVTDRESDRVTAEHARPGRRPVRSFASSRCLQDGPLRTPVGALGLLPASGHRPRRHLGGADRRFSAGHGEAGRQLTLATVAQGLAGDRRSSSGRVDAEKPGALAGTRAWPGSISAPVPQDPSPPRTASEPPAADGVAPLSNRPNVAAPSRAVATDIRLLAFQVHDPVLRTVRDRSQGNGCPTTRRPEPAGRRRLTVRPAPLGGRLTGCRGRPRVGWGILRTYWSWRPRSGRFRAGGRATFWFGVAIRSAGPRVGGRTSGCGVKRKDDSDDGASPLGREWRRCRRVRR